MKRLLVLLLLTGAFAAHAQSTNLLNAPTNLSAFGVETNAIPATTSETLEAQMMIRMQRSISLYELKPNEISVGRTTLSGITIEAIKKSNPLQLFNPFAPADYGSPEDNVVRVPPNKRIAGLKIFAVKF